MDGGSKDHTREVVEAYGPLVTTFISKPDQGQLDALQQALAMATGDICYWLNADDAVMPGAFQTAVDAFTADPSIDILFSDDYAFDEEKRLLAVGATISNLNFWDHFLFYRQMYSECIFWRRAITPQALPLDTSLRVYTDYSFFLPLTHQRKCRWVPQRLGAFRMHAAQNSQRFVDRGTAERELIKQRMRERLGMTAADFEQRRRRRAWRFQICHHWYPKLHAGMRYAWRKLTFDRARQRTANFFFDQWLQPPAEVLERLGPLAETLLHGHAGAGVGTTKEKA